MSPVSPVSPVAGELVGDVGPRGGLPAGPRGVGVEQGRLVEEVAQDRGPAPGEVGVVQVGVLPAHPVDVLPVALRVGGQDRQVGVAEHLAVGVVLGRAVRGREQDQPDHLGDQGGVEALELHLGEHRRALLVVPGAVVDRVVEPRGQQHGVAVGPGSGGHERVDVVEHLREVAQVVVAPRRVAVRRDQPVAQVVVAGQRPPPDRVEHGPILAGSRPAGQPEARLCSGRSASGSGRCRAA